MGTSGTSPTNYKVMAGAYPPLKGDGSWGLSPTLWLLGLSQAVRDSNKFAGADPSRHQGFPIGKWSEKMLDVTLG